MIPVFSVRIENHVQEYDREKFRLYVQSLPDGDYELTIRRVRRVKSRQAEEFYWSVIVPLWKDTAGCITINEAHREILEECAVRDSRGHVITTSDPDFTMEHQKVLIDGAIKKLEFMGCRVPLPHEVEA